MAKSNIRRMAAAGLLGVVGLWGCQTVPRSSVTASRQTDVPALSGSHLPPSPSAVAPTEVGTKSLPNVMAEAIAPVAAVSLSGPPPFPTEARPFTAPVVHPAVPTPPRTLAEATESTLTNSVQTSTVKFSKIQTTGIHTGAAQSGAVQTADHEFEPALENWKPTPSSGHARASGISITKVANWVPAGCAPISRENPGPSNPVTELESRVNAVEEQLSSARNDMKTVHQTLKVSEDRISELSRELTHWQRETRRLESDMRAQQQADLKSLEELTSAVNLLIEKQRLTQSRNGETR